MQHFDPPAPFKAQLQGIVDAYLSLQSALAEDELEEARKAVGAVDQAIEAVDMKLVKGPAHMAWMRELPSLRKAAKDARASKDISELRAAFSLFSEALPVLVRMFRLADERPLHILECPMAFSNRGATWLQTDKDVGQGCPQPVLRGSDVQVWRRGRFAGRSCTAGGART
jgi:Cu(I)/Ag(I) efflux system membrane fusion protein